MVEFLPNTFNVFVSFSSSDEIQHDIFNSLCNYYDTHNQIKIIDVSQRVCTASDSLCNGIISKIKTSDLFICILSPIMQNEIIGLNLNVILELGTAMSCLEPENVCIFIEDDENKKHDFERLRPSMISHLKYNTYMCSETENNYRDIVECIEEKLENWDKEEYFSVNNIIKNDVTLQSIIKREMLNLMFENRTQISDENLAKLENYVKSYNSSEIINLYFSFMYDNIPLYANNGFELMNSFFDILVNKILDWDYSWISNNTNQISVINLLNNIQYQLFDKFKNIKNEQIDTARKNFAIAVFDLLKCHKVSHNDSVKNIIITSLTNTQCDDYTQFVNRLNYIHKKIAFIPSVDVNRKKNYYEDLILNSTTPYNNTYIDNS